MELTLGADPVVDGSPEKIVDHMVGEGLWCVGTPDDLIARIRGLDEQTGGFGGRLLFIAELGSNDHTKRSLELTARHVVPEFQDSLANVRLSGDIAESHRAEFSEQRKRSVEKAGGEIAKSD